MARILVKIYWDGGQSDDSGVGSSFIEVDFPYLPDLVPPETPTNNSDNPDNPDTPTDGGTPTDDTVYEDDFDYFGSATVNLNPLI